MALRVSAFRFLSALVVAGFAFAAVPASAQTQVLCSYDQYGRAYNCHHTGLVVPQPQQQCGSCCNSCGNRGLFTSTWVQPASPCGYNPCQQAVVQQQYYQPAPQQYYQPAPQQYTNEDDDDDTNVGNTGERYRSHRYVGTGHRVHRDTVTTRHAVTTRRSGAARQCGYVNGKWHCVNRVSQNQPKPHLSRN